MGRNNPIDRVFQESKTQSLIKLMNTSKYRETNGNNNAWQNKGHGY
jgi:hypothetical protein